MSAYDTRDSIKQNDAATLWTVLAILAAGLLAYAAYGTYQRTEAYQNQQAALRTAEGTTGAMLNDMAPASGGEVDSFSRAQYSTPPSGADASVGTVASTGAQQ